MITYSRSNLNDYELHEFYEIFHATVRSMKIRMIRVIRSQKRNNYELREFHKLFQVSVLGVKIRIIRVIRSQKKHRAYALRFY